jgi:hypothetical protein
LLHYISTTFDIISNAEKYNSQLVLYIINILIIINENK